MKPGCLLVLALVWIRHAQCRLEVVGVFYAAFFCLYGRITMQQKTMIILWNDVPADVSKCFIASYQAKVWQHSSPILTPNEHQRDCLKHETNSVGWKQKPVWEGVSAAKADPEGIMKPTDFIDEEFIAFTGGAAATVAATAFERWRKKLFFWGNPFLFFCVLMFFGESIGFRLCLN